MEDAAPADFGPLAAALAASIDAIVDDYMARLRVEEPEWSRDRPELRETARVITRASILAEVESFGAGEPPPADLPAADAEFARAAARLGYGPAVLGAAYRRGHACQWDAWFALVESEVAEPDLRRQLLRRGSDFFFAYARHLSESTLELYGQEHDRMVEQREHQRMHLVHRLLEGDEVSVQALGYDPSASNRALVAWGPEASELATDAARLLHRPLLLVGVLEGEFWGWCGGEPTGDLARELARLEDRSGSALAFGDEGAGVQGFRSSHDQARRAERSGRSAGRPLTLHADVALEVLAGADEDRAARFLEAELTGIDGADRRSERLRHTVLAWFAAGQNAASAAAALGVHEQTVAQRLRAVEERIGHPIASRRAELETALRLRDYLPPR